jgi:AraC-like DNA-binding protein
MEYIGRTPSPPLDTFVERIWYCSDAPPQARERVLPGGGTVDLVVNLVEDEIRIYDPANPGSVRACSGAVVRGTSTRSFLIDSRLRASMVGVHFRPGGAFPFLGISPSEIVDAHVQLDDLWGCSGRNLREQLIEADSPSERLRLVEAALLWRLRRARPGHPAARAALDAFRTGGDDVRVAEVAVVVGLSHRRFIQVFEREVGLTPKLYARLQRFHRVKQRIATLGEPLSWAAFALACGYFDQSHMIRDFVEFSGMSPASYLRGRTDETMFDHLVHAYPGHHGAFLPA